MSLVIRPRNPWESIDLGFRLCREHWRALYGSWIAASLPLFCIVFFLLGPESLWVLIVIRWLKPIVDRVPLIVLSRAVFSSVTTTRETLTLWPDSLRYGLFSSLLWRRLDPSLSFTLPIWQLERLYGSQWRQRARIIHQNTRGAAIWLTFVCLALELIAMTALFALFVLMTPEKLAIDWLEVNQDWFWVLLNSLHLFALLLVGPLNIAGGFALYLNRRTILEGWDIEIAFRQMTPRISAALRRAAV